MYIRRNVLNDESISLNRQESFNYDSSDTSLPDLSANHKPASGEDNGVTLGIVRFCIVLGGILFVIIITGVITYIYRKKLLKSKRPKAAPKTNTISYILDYYEHDYVEPTKDSGITVMKVDKSDISIPATNEDIRTLPILTSQISAPMPNASVSIYNKERANSLAKSVENMNTTNTTVTPPVPAITSINPKSISRNNLEGFEMLYPNSREPEMSKYITREPEMSKYTTREPEMSKYTTREPEMSKYTTREPETSKYTTREPEMSKYTTREPEMSKYTTREPEMSKYTTREPEMSKYNTREPEMSKYTTRESEMSKYTTRESRSTSKGSEMLKYISRSTSKGSEMLKSRGSRIETLSNATSFDNILPEIFDDSSENAVPIDINAKWFTYPIDSPTIPLSPSRVPKGFGKTDEQSSSDESVINDFPDYNRKSKRNLRIRIDTFDQFNLPEDKPYTPSATLTPKSELREELKDEEDKVDTIKIVQDVQGSDRYRSFGTSTKNNKHKRNGSIFEHKYLIRSKTIT